MKGMPLIGSEALQNLCLKLISLFFRCREEASKRMAAAMSVRKAKEEESQSPHADGLH